MPLWERLPVVKIPLRPNDTDAPLDLQAVMAMTHPDELAASSERLRRQLDTGEADENSIMRAATGQNAELVA